MGCDEKTVRERGRREEERTAFLPMGDEREFPAIFVHKYPTSQEDLL